MCMLKQEHDHDRYQRQGQQDPECLFMDNEHHGQQTGRMSREKKVPGHHHPAIGQVQDKGVPERHTACRRLQWNHIEGQDAEGIDDRKGEESLHEQTRSGDQVGDRNEKAQVDHRKYPVGEIPGWHYCKQGIPEDHPVPFVNKRKKMIQEHDHAHQIDKHRDEPLGICFGAHRLLPDKLRSRDKGTGTVCALFHDLVHAAVLGAVQRKACPLIFLPVQVRHGFFDPPFWEQFYSQGGQPV